MARRKKQTSQKPKTRSWSDQFLQNSQPLAHGDTADSVTLRALYQQNKPGFWGLGLSLTQLAGHISWVTLVVMISSSNQAQSMDASSPLAWLIVVLFGGSLILTGVALFVCLFYGLRRAPRTPAVVGFFLAFFIGILASALVFMQGLRSMAG